MGGDGTKKSSDERAAKLAEALRANLHRRKSQSRQRKTGQGVEQKDEKPATKR